MTVPKEPVFSAYMAVLTSAITKLRHMALSQAPYDEMADLADAIHNIPELLNHWEDCDSVFLWSQLEAYDEKWTQSTNFSLTKIFQNVVDLQDQTKIINERRKQIEEKPDEEI